MRWLLHALLPVTIALSGCTSTSYDFMETASIKQPRFEDKDPQDFGANNPQRHKVHGIDVSKWNGDVDWPTVRQSGVSFVFIKATEGKDMVDPRFDEYWRKARAAGLPHAPYHFYYFCSTADEQADWFIRNVPKGLGLVMLECATGQFPYPPHDSFYELLEEVVEQPPPFAPSDQFSVEFTSFISEW